MAGELCGRRGTVLFLRAACLEQEDMNARRDGFGGDGGGDSELDGVRAGMPSPQMDRVPCVAFRNGGSHTGMSIQKEKIQADIPPVLQPSASPTRRRSAATPSRASPATASPGRTPTGPPTSTISAFSRSEGTPVGWAKSPAATLEFAQSIRAILPTPSNRDAGPPWAILPTYGVASLQLTVRPAVRQSLVRVDTPAACALRGW